MSPYLIKRGKRYMYRRRIPLDLLFAYHLPQIRFSLKTVSKREADKIALHVDERLEKAFCDIRAMRLTQSQARSLVAAATEFGGVAKHEPTLRDVAKEYERTKGQHWATKGKQEYWKAVDTVEGVIGNRVIRLIDRAVVVKFRDQLHATGIKPRTVNKYIQRLSSIINYAVTTGAANTNPCTAAVKFEIAKSEITENRYIPYSDADVQWILCEMLEHPAENKRWTTYMYWLPLIAAFSGARLGDLADLTKGNFERRGELECMTIGNNKTGAEARTIPIHSRLMELGLLEWVETLPDGAKLFHIPLHRRKGEGGDNEYNYKWYMRRLREKIRTPRKVFHSWRSTLATRLNDAGVPSVHRADLLGHERQGDCETDRTYTTLTQLRVLKEALERLDYPGVDWNRVRLRTG